MTNITHNNTNQQKITRAMRMLHEVLEQSLKRGYYGTIELVIEVQDGTVQKLGYRKEQFDR